MCLLIKKDNICEVFLQQQKTQPTNEQASEINYWKEKKKKKKSQLPGDTAHRMEDEDPTNATTNT